MAAPISKDLYNTHKTASANTNFPLQVKAVTQSYLGKIDGGQFENFRGKEPR